MIQVYPDVSGNYWAEELETGKRVKLTLKGNRLVAPSGRAVARIGALPAIPVAVKGLIVFANKIGPFIKKIGGFLKKVIKTQKVVLTEVTTLDSIIKIRLGQSLSREEIYDKVIDPLKRHFKLFSGDIPNVKIGGNYNKEMERAANYYAWYLEVFQPNDIEKWVARVNAGDTIGRALLTASGVSTRSELKPFSLDYINAALAKDVAMDTSITTQIDTNEDPSGNFFNEAANAYKTIRDAAGNILQPGTPEYNQALEAQGPQRQQAGFGGTGMVIALGIGLALAMGASGGSGGRKKRR